MRLGDSLQWNKDLEDYPASAWTLTYRILPQSGASGVQTITAAASGSQHQVRVTSTTSATYTAGTYWLIGYVTNATDRFQIYLGKLVISANPASATGLDGRSYLQRILDLLETSIEANEAPRNVIRYSYGGVTSEVRTLDDVFKARERVLAAIANEEAAKLGQQRRILTRFLSPR